MSMGKFMSSILTCSCCEENKEPEEDESNPRQKLLDEDVTKSYTSEIHNSLETHKSPTAISENSTTSTRSIYYTPSSSFKDSPFMSVDSESNTVTS